MSIPTSLPQWWLSGGKPLKNKNIKAATIIAFLILPMSGLITDMYIPSMPHMATELHSSEAAIQLTLTLFLVSYGLVQFITGNLIDKFGRYRLTLISLIVFILSNLVIIATHSLAVIYAMRILQGVSTGFIVVAKRAFFVDVYEGDKRKNYLSMMSIVWSAAPVVAPFVGGYLQHYFNWQSNFYVLAAYGLVVLLLELIYSGETISTFRALQIQTIVADYKIMFRDRIFVCGLLVCGLSYGTTMLFSLSGAFIIEHKMHFSPVMAGYGALVMGLAWMAGGLIGKASLHKAFLPKLRLTNSIQLLVTILMFSVAASLNNIYTLIIFAFLIHLCVGFIFNNYFALCLGRYPQMAGIVSGLSGGSTFLVTALSSYAVVGIIQPESQFTLGIAYLVMAIAILFILFLVLKPRAGHLLFAKAKA